MLTVVVRLAGLAGCGGVSQTEPGPALGTTGCTAAEQLPLPAAAAALSSLYLIHRPPGWVDSTQQRTPQTRSALLAKTKYNAIVEFPMRDNICFKRLP